MAFRLGVDSIALRHYAYALLNLFYAWLQLLYEIPFMRDCICFMTFRLCVFVLALWHYGYALLNLLYDIPFMRGCICFMALRSCVVAFALRHSIHA